MHIVIFFYGKKKKEKREKKVKSRIAMLQQQKILPKGVNKKGEYKETLKNFACSTPSKIRRMADS